MRANANYEIGNYVAAKKDLDGLVNKNFVNADIYSLLSKVYFQHKMYSNSVEFADLSLGLNPSQGDVLLIKGRSLYRLGKKQEACLAWNRAIDYGSVDAKKMFSQYCGN
jgi:tetratricopeptide (TPR) repeat protein